MADTAMASKSVGDVDRFPNIIATGSELADGAHRQVTPADAKPANMARISGDSGKQQGFQSKLQESWKTAGDEGPSPLTIAPGENKLAGVLKGKLIHFSPLWQM